MSGIVKKLFKYTVNSDYRFLINANRGKYDSWDDEKYLKRKFKAIVGRELNFQNVQTFNEKLQWLKVHDHNPLYTMMVDKYLVRDYIREKLGEEYLIPLIGAWDNPEEIDFDALPDQFVLKCNHNSGVGMYICRDKSKMDVNKVKRELRRGLAQDYYLTSREWPYKDVPRKIICEKFMSNCGETDLKDYKIQCVNGKIDHIFVCVGRSDPQSLRYYYFDEAWNYLPYSTNERCDADFFQSLKPATFSKMVEIAGILSAGLPEVRVDLYEINGKVYFGELTFYTQSGFDTSITHEADCEIGRRLALPEM